MASGYVPSFKYTDVFTGRKYSPDNPIPKIMRSTQQQGANYEVPERTVRNFDLNSNPSTSTQFVDHHVDLQRGTHQRSQRGRTYQTPRRGRVEENLPSGSYQRSCPQTMATVAMVVQRRIGKTFKTGSERNLYDRTAKNYEWLPFGWLCEERIMVHRRRYRYYYSPNGCLYRSKFEALTAMSHSNL